MLDKVVVVGVEEVVVDVGAGGADGCGVSGFILGYILFFVCVVLFCVLRQL